MEVITGINTQIYNRLLTCAGSALWSNRVYSLVAPINSVFPYVVFNDIYVIDEHYSAIKTYNVQYQIDIWSKTQAECRTGLGYVDDEFRHKPISFTGFKALYMRPNSFNLSSTTEQQTQYYRGMVTLNFLLSVS